MENVSIFGAGYVGIALSIALASKGCTVYCVDNNPEKLDMLSAGKSPIKERGFDAAIKGFTLDQKIIPTPSAADAVVNSDISFVCVGTPSDESGAVNTSYIENVSKEIGNGMQLKNDYHLVAIRSTVPLGTSENAANILQATSTKEYGKDFGVCMNPEFLREGSSLEDFFDGAFNIVGSNNSQASAKLRDFYSSIGLQNIHEVNFATAESFKYINNWWHGAKIGFANEVGRWARANDVDPTQLMEIFVQDDRLNVSPAYLRPGFAFGGSCLPKDTRALSNLASNSGVEMPLLNALLPSNYAHVLAAKERIEALKPKKIGVAGLVFKPGTDDFRESPYLTLVGELQNRRYETFVYDKQLQSPDLLGANRTYLDNFFEEASAQKITNLDALAQECDLIVVGTLTNDERKQLARKTQDDTTIFDLNGSMRDMKVGCNYIQF